MATWHHVEEDLGPPDWVARWDMADVERSLANHAAFDLLHPEAMDGDGDASRCPPPDASGHGEGRVDG